ncbi:hypothetical protein Sru01_53200 [Sphaerisporangium rufum]|uniref:Uncharacterized protein n=1 Tax=Sphaerisporangium rufum TaxID=1381558 RepID=A0A919V3Q3_9ACTN|nr:hypothetical protein Sru01_53200 [Sphaerisporangium rufum]
MGKQPIQSANRNKAMNGAANRNPIGAGSRSGTIGVGGDGGRTPGTTWD